MYTTGRDGGGGRGFFLGGVFKFFEGKTGNDKNVWRREGRMPIFLDLIERLSICNIIDKPPPKWSSNIYFLVQWMMISLLMHCNVLCSNINQLYLHNHYHLYFNLLLLITSQIVFILIVIINIIIVITVIIIKINPPFSLSKLLIKSSASLLIRFKSTFTA